MLWNFLIDIWKVIFLGCILPKQSTFFRVTTLWLIINNPVWAWNRDLKLIGRYENAKNVIYLKNEVFNQLVELRNSKLTCINYHFKWRFHTVQENILQFSDSNDLFGPIVIFPDSSIEIVVAVLFPYSHHKLWQNGDKMVTKC